MKKKKEKQKHALCRTPLLGSVSWLIANTSGIKRHSADSIITPLHEPPKHFLACPLAVSRFIVHNHNSARQLRQQGPAHRSKKIIPPPLKPEWMTSKTQAVGAGS
jgi:hypothetical protein